MVVVKWCKCFNVKICLVNPPTPAGDLKWVAEHTSMRRCGESKVQGNVVTMELEKMVQARMVQGWQVWKCFNCCIDVCAIDLNNSVALVNMDMEDNDDVTQLQLDNDRVYSDCFRVIVNTAPEDTPTISERDPSSIENFNILQEFVDEYLADAERVMEKRVRQYIKEQNEIINQLRSKVNAERTIIWRKMCSVVSNSAPPPASAVLSSTPSSASPINAAVAAGRSRASSVSRPHSRSVSGAVAPFSGFPGSGSMTNPVAMHAPALGSTFGSTQSSIPTTPTPIAKPQSETLPEAVVPVAPTDATPVQTTPPKQIKTENATKWQAAPRPGSTEIKPRMQKSSSPNIFNFDDEEEDFELSQDDSDDDIDEEPSPAPSPSLSHTTIPQPKIPDSINLLGTSLPVAIPARPHPSSSSNAPSARVPPHQSSNTPKKSPFSIASSSPNPNSNAHAGSVRAPTTVSMSAVSMANVSSTAPTHPYHALRPQTQTVAPMSTSASESNELMVPKQSWRENYLGEAAEESLPVEMASSFIVPLSLNRRLKSLI